MTRVLVSLSTEEVANFHIEFWSSVIATGVSLFLLFASLRMRHRANTVKTARAILLPCYYRLLYATLFVFGFRALLLGATGPYPKVPLWYQGANYVRDVTDGGGDVLVLDILYYALYWWMFESLAMTVTFVFFVADVPTSKAVGKATRLGMVAALLSMLLTMAGFAGSLGLNVSPSAQVALDTVFLLVQSVPSVLAFVSPRTGCWRMRPAVFPYAAFSLVWRLVLMASVLGRIHGSVVGGVITIFRDVGLPLSIALAIAQDTRYWQDVIRSAAKVAKSVVEVGSRLPREAGSRGGGGGGGGGGSGGVLVGRGARSGSATGPAARRPVSMSVGGASGRVERVDTMVSTGTSLRAPEDDVQVDMWTRFQICGVARQRCAACLGIGSGPVEEMEEPLLGEGASGGGGAAEYPYGSDGHDRAEDLFVTFDRLHFVKQLYCNEPEDRYVYEGTLLTDGSQIRVAIKQSPLNDNKDGPLGPVLPADGASESSVSDREDSESDSATEMDVEVDLMGAAAGGGGALLGAGPSKPKGERRLQRLKPKFRKALENHFRESSFLREAEHPYVVKLIGVSTDMERAIIVLELCHSSLTKYLSNLHRKGEKVPSRVKLRFAVQLAKAIRHLHYRYESSFILHRDIKLDNVLVRDNLSLCIADFDIATFYYPDDDLDDARPTIPVGTYTHQAPELLAGRPWTPAGDIYSVGVVLWEIWAEKHAWSGRSRQDTELAVIEGRRPDTAASHHEPMPPSLQAIVDRCWHQNPKERPDAIELVSLLVPLRNDPAFSEDISGGFNNPSLQHVEDVLTPLEDGFPYAKRAREMLVSS